MYLIGQARDIHQLIKKNQKTKVVLGGYVTKSNYAIKAWSDGDLVLHAISNCILGAIAKGDIGMYFPDTNIKNHKLNSKKILSFCLDLLKKKKYQIVNLDLTILCDKIMINPLREQIKKSLINLLAKNNKKIQINVKATRFEQNLKVIECDAITLLQKLM